MKKLILFTLTILMVLSLVVLPGFAAEGAKDLEVGSEYTDPVELNAGNAGKWVPGLGDIKQHLSYSFALSEEGLKVKISVPVDELQLGSMLQLNFNPGFLIPEDDNQVGLFVTAYPREGNTVDFAQHHQSTKLQAIESGDTVAITLEHTVSIEDDNHIIEFTLPVEFFQIIGISEDFVFDEEAELGYVLFCFEEDDEGIRIGASYTGDMPTLYVEDLEYTKLTFPAETVETEEPVTDEPTTDEPTTDEPTTETPGETDEKEGMSAGTIAAIVIVAVLVVAVIVFLVTKKKN